MAEVDLIDNLATYRDRFPILEHTTYLISNSLGAVPFEAEDALREYYSTWASRGVRAWEETWWTMVADLGDRLAPLLGAGAGEIVFQPNVTIAHAVAFSSVDFQGARNRIVTDEMHFPSILYLIEQQRARGAEPVVIPTVDGVSIDADRLLESIDERTAVVNVSHVLFKSSYIQDVAAICEKARRVGALSMIDGYQSVGAIPVDVESLGSDVYIGGCLKWLCGGPGAAFLHVRPESRERLRPTLTGWMAHVEPFAFRPDLTRRTDAWRFLHGTPNISALHAARPGIEIIREVGIEAIRSKSIRQTGDLIEGAEARGYRCATPRDSSRRAGTVSIDVPNGYAVSKALKTREILCDFRPGAGVRLSPHFYTLDAEIDHALEAIDDILKTGSWREFTGSRSTVT